MSECDPKKSPGFTGSVLFTKASVEAEKEAKRDLSRKDRPITDLFQTVAVSGENIT